MRKNAREYVMRENFYVNSHVKKEKKTSLWPLLHDFTPSGLSLNSTWSVEAGCCFKFYRCPSDQCDSTPVAVCIAAKTSQSTVKEGQVLTHAGSLHFRIFFNIWQNYCIIRIVDVVGECSKAPGENLKV